MKQVSIMLLAGWLWTLVAAEALASDAIVAPQKLVSLEFVDEHGRQFDNYATTSGSSDVYRAYLEAMPGARYAIRARNLSGERIGVVIAVDGRNIVSGERSELKSSESMYVLDPYQTATYEGWRTSVDEVRRFYFTDMKNSYASRIGDESAMGVIAAAIFKAKPESNQVRQHDKTASAPEPAAEASDAARASAGQSSQAGTGFGESQHSRAIRVAFSPVRRASQRSFFKYEWSEQLCARGVKSCAPPNRFWPESRQGFVPLPPGEHG